MYLGILFVSGLAFFCSTEAIPEINEQMKLVPFTQDFKFTMTATMIVDYVGCWLVEKVLKAAFSDYKPKDIAVRRPEQLEREEKRRAVEKVEEEKIRKEKRAELEKKRLEDLERRKRELRERWRVQ
jgi:manganese-transporting P-type ATPase